MMAARSDNIYESPVEAFILQQHRGLVIRFVATRIVNRVVCLALACFIIFASGLSTLQMVALILAASFVAYVWYYEQISLARQMRNIEESLAERTGGDWEDIYIRSRHVTSDYSAGLRFFNFEPMLWLLIILLLMAVSVFLGK